VKRLGNGRAAFSSKNLRRLNRKVISSKEISKMPLCRLPKWTRLWQRRQASIPQREARQRSVSRSIVRQRSV
jgi:hypothetical protein